MTASETVFYVHEQWLASNPDMNKEWVWVMNSAIVHELLVKYYLSAGLFRVLLLGLPIQIDETTIGVDIIEKPKTIN